MSSTRGARGALRVAGAALTVALTLGLTGCGVTGTSFQPGVAADVDGTVVSTGRVDSLVGSYCEAIQSVLGQDNNVVPLSFFRSGVAGQLALVTAAEQMAEDYGVEPTSDYDRAVSDIEGQTSELTESQRDAVIEIEAGSTYINAVESAVGAQLLGEEGVADPGPDASVERGVEAFTEWLADHDIRLNPRYGIELDGAAINTRDQQVSVAVSDVAQSGLAETPDQAYAASLPQSQRCG